MTVRRAHERRRHVKRAKHRRKDYLERRRINKARLFVSKRAEIRRRRLAEHVWGMDLPHWLRWGW